MARDQQEPSLIKPILTESSSLVLIQVCVPEKCFTMSMIPTAGQVYKETKLPQVRIEEFGEYIFLWPDENPPEGYVAFVFARNQTTEERDTAVQTWYGQENYHWPRELLALTPIVIEIGSIFDTPTWDAHTSFSIDELGAESGSINAGETKMLMLKKIRESYSGKTRLKYERFLSRTPWTDEFLVSDSIEAPQPGVVTWDLPGSKETLEDVLHNGVFIPRSYFRLMEAFPQTTDYADPQTGHPSTLTSVPPQTYPATNHAIWTTHTATQEVKQRGYYFERLKVTAYAPPRPDIWT